MTETIEKKSNISWPSLLQAIFSGGAVLLSLGLVALIVFGLFTEALNPSGDPYMVSTLLSLMLAGLFVGGLFAGSLFFSLMRLSGRAVELGGWWVNLRKIFHPRWMLAGYPVVVLLGYLANRSSFARNTAMPVLNVLSMVIPVVVLVWLALRGLPKGSPQLGWGALSLGLAIGPTAVLLLEILAMILMVFVLAISAGMNPDLMNVFSDFSRLAFESDNPYLLDDAVGRLLNTPQVLIALLLVIAGFVPLIEEFFKPISVWVLLGRKLRPVDGWVIGALSGAGFAIFESLSQATVTEDWWIGVIGRLGASIPHVFTAAFMGYTLALARTQKKYGKIFTAFLGVVAIHAAWNASSVLIAVSGYAPPDGWLSPGWTPVFLGVIVSLAVGMVIALLRINRKLRQEANQMPFDELPPAASLPHTLEPGLKEIQIDGPDNNTD
jgi:RsiW-degrading membrane proteinase PrsW (M82 family)